MGVPGIPSNKTCTPARVGLTPPCALIVNRAGVEGPSNVPLMVIGSPGAMAPPTLLALLVTATGCGGGNPVTVNVTLTGIGVASTPGAVMEMVPPYTPGARPWGFTVTERFCGVDRPFSDDPLAGVTDSQLLPPPVVVMPTLNCTTPPVLVT